MGLTVSSKQTEVVKGRYGNSRGQGKGGPAVWLELLTSEIWKIVNKINNWP